MDLKLDLHDRLRVSTPAALLSLDASALQVLQGPPLPAVPALHKPGACVACVAGPRVLPAPGTHQASLQKDMNKRVHAMGIMRCAQDAWVLLEPVPAEALPAAVPHAAADPCLRARPAGKGKAPGRKPGRKPKGKVPA